MSGINEPPPSLPPSISSLEGTFAPNKSGSTSGKIKLTVLSEMKEISARTEKPSGLLDRLNNYFGTRKWVPIKLKEGEKVKDVWVNVDDLAKKLECSPESIRKAAKVAKVAAKAGQATGEVETLIAEAKPYQEMRAHFKDRLSEQQIRHFCRMATTLGANLEQAKSSKAEGQAITEGHHKFSHVPVTILADAELGTEAGKGISKTVYKIEHGASKKVYAQAVANPDSVEDSQKSSHDTEKEAFLLTKLSGEPGIIPLKHTFYYLDKSNNLRPGLQLEFAEESLSKNMKASNNAQTDTFKYDADKVNIFEDIVDGIQSCHRNGITHSDIKPDNILLKTDASGKKRAVLTDFGAAYMKNSPNVQLCEKEWNSGTVQYVPPELQKGKIVDKKKVDGEKVDAFALGVTMYNFLYNKDPPWMGESITDGMVPDKMNLVQIMITQETLYKDPPIGPIIAKLINEDPKKRPTMAEVKTMIAEARKELQNRANP